MTTSPGLPYTLIYMLHIYCFHVGFEVFLYGCVITSGVSSYSTLYSTLLCLGVILISIVTSRGVRKLVVITHRRDIYLIHCRYIRIRRNRVRMHYVLIYMYTLYTGVPVRKDHKSNRISEQCSTLAA